MLMMLVSFPCLLACLRELGLWHPVFPVARNENNSFVIGFGYSQGVSTETISRPAYTRAVAGELPMSLMEYFVGILWGRLASHVHSLVTETMNVVF